MLKEKSFLAVKIDKLQSELDNYKIKLIENEIRNKRETVERLEISNARRIKTKFRRMKFIGEPKSFQEILSLMGSMDSFPLKSKDRLAALEEFCIYGNSNGENLEKLRTLNGAKYAAKSLASSDPSVVARALVFCAMLAKGNERACEVLSENGALSYLVQYLNASNDSYRVETLNVISALSLFGTTSKELFSKFNILQRIVVLLEEGLQMNSDLGYD